MRLAYLFAAYAFWIVFVGGSIVLALGLRDEEWEQEFTTDRRLVLIAISALCWIAGHHGKKDKP